MAEQRLLSIDIEPKSNSSAAVDDRTEKPLWTRSDNTFRFNFSPDIRPARQERPSPSDGGTEPGARQTSFTGQGSAFAFNFHISPAPPVEDMETTETPDISSPDSQQERPPLLQEVNSPPEPSVLQKAKKKKKKKSGKKTPSSSTEAQQTPSSAEGIPGGEDTNLSAEEQLNRQLDWCIEQLESGMRSQKGTPKQKEETSRALKTLKSSKAPLAKKRQVMRAMTGDYRKKMDEEKGKQHKLIQSEIASAQVKVASSTPKKSVFHRRAEVKPQTSAAENLQQDAGQNEELKAQTNEGGFVLIPSKEEFHFNFF